MHFFSEFIEYCRTTAVENYIFGVKNLSKLGEKQAAELLF